MQSGVPWDNPDNKSNYPAILYFPDICITSWEECRNLTFHKHLQDQVESNRLDFNSVYYWDVMHYVMACISSAASLNSLMSKMKKSNVWQESWVKIDWVTTGKFPVVEAASLFNIDGKLWYNISTCTGLYQHLFDARLYTI